MIYIFEGMDNCLKDTLIQGLRGLLPPETQVLKFSNPPKSDNYEDYQKRHFKDMFRMLATSVANSPRNIILNRAHLGEFVYAPIYRNYPAEWVFDLEQEFLAVSPIHISISKLLMFYDSDNIRLKMREDGKSMSKMADEKVNQERARFLEAFSKSNFQLKVDINISDYVLPRVKDPTKEIDVSAILDKIL